MVAQGDGGGRTGRPEGTRKVEGEESSPRGVDASPTGTDARDAPTTGAQQGLPDDGARKGNSERTRRQSYCIRGARLSRHRLLVHVEGGGDQPGEDEQARGGAHYRGDGEPCTRCYNAGWRNCPICRDKPVLRMAKCRGCSEKGGGGVPDTVLENDGGGGATRAEASTILAELEQRTGVKLGQPKVEPCHEADEDEDEDALPRAQLKAQADAMASPEARRAAVDALGDMLPPEPALPDLPDDSDEDDESDDVGRPTSDDGTVYTGEPDPDREGHLL